MRDRLLTWMRKIKIKYLCQRHKTATATSSNLCKATNKTFILRLIRQPTEGLAAVLTPIARMGKAISPQIHTARLWGLLGIGMTLSWFSSKNTSLTLSTLVQTTMDQPIEVDTMGTRLPSTRVGGITHRLCRTIQISLASAKLSISTWQGCTTLQDRPSKIMTKK